MKPGGFFTAVIGSRDEVRVSEVSSGGLPAAHNLRLPIAFLTCFFFFFPPHVRWIFNFPLLSLPVLTSSSVKQAAMQTHETKGAEVYTNGSAGHMNGGQYTRMREVAFEKNPSEPMVRCQAWLDTHTHTVWSLDLPSWFHSLLSPAGSHSETKWQAEMHCGQNTAWRHDPQAR